MSGGVSRFSSQSHKNETVRNIPSYQDLVKDINPASLTVVEPKPSTPKSVYLLVL
jgi:hypothetical protein